MSITLTLTDPVALALLALLVSERTARGIVGRAQAAWRVRSGRHHLGCRRQIPGSSRTEDGSAD